MENEYVANDNNLFVPTKKLKLFADAHGVHIKPNGNGSSQFVFTIPDYLNFVNPETLRLRYNLEFTGRGMPKPDPAAACSSLYRHMRVQTKNGMELLEEVSEYSSRVAMEYSYGQDEGKIADRAINEGLSLTNNAKNQMFWAAQNLPSQGITTAPVAKKCAISLPLWSGILGEQAQVLPVAAVGGVRLQMETNNLKKSVRLALDSKKGKGTKVKTQVAAATWNNASLNHLVDVELEGGDGIQSNYQIGDAVYYDVGGVDTLIGIVTSIGTAASQFQLQVRGNVAASTDGFLLAVGTEIYTVPKDRFEGWSPGVNMQGTVGAVSAAITLALTEAAVKVDYTMTDMEMIVEQISPPDSYVNALVKKINSGEGLVMTYKNTTMHKVNLVGTQGMLNASIPNTSKRVYSVNCMPLASVDSYDAGNLTAKPDQIESYQFVINDQLIPDQKVPLSRLSMTPAYVEQLHLQETRKSLVNSSVFVKSLQNAEKNFVIGRAVSLYGAVSDVTKSDLSLRLEYGAATYQKTLNCYLCTARTLVIKRDEINVFY